MEDKLKAIALISGGLDSALAARLVQEQGIEVIGIHCGHPFHAAPARGETPYPPRTAAQLGIELVERDVSEKILALVKNPAHGYGRNLNPCIDCRILYLGEAHALMKERNAQFLVTGEVLGQRPMSQRRDAMDIIDRDSGLRGRVLRPLSAKLLRPTLPEDKGWVDREKLLAISSRGRKDQLALAERFGITEFSTPAGGCLLTNEGFAAKVRDLLEHEPGLTREDVERLKVGRHFRISDRAKLAVGRDERENERLKALARGDDLIIDAVDLPGPLGLLQGGADRSELERACAIVGRYVKNLVGEIRFEIRKVGNNETELLAVRPLGRREADQDLIGKQT